MASSRNDISKVLQASLATRTSFNYLPWLFWGIAVVFVFYQFMLQSYTSVMVPQLMKAFSINVVQLSFLSASFLFTYLFSQIPAGLIVDRIGPRKLITYSALLCVIACIIFASAENYSTAVMSRLLMGLGTAPAVVCGMYIASNRFPSTRFAFIAGLTEMIGLFGGAAGEEVIAFGVSDFGWRGTMYGCAIAGCVIAAIAFFVIRDKRSPEQRQIDTNVPIKESLSKTFMLPQAWINGIFSGLLFSLLSAFAALWCIPFMMKLYGIKLQIAAGASALIFLGAGLGNPFVGWLSDQMGRRRPIMIVGAFGSFICLMMVLYVPGIHFSNMLALMFVLGLFSSAYIIPFAVVREITCPKTRGTAMGFVNTLSIAVGGPILQPLIGWLLQNAEPHTVATDTSNFTIHSYQVALSVLPVCYFIALILVFFVKETYCREQGIEDRSQT